MRWIHQNQVLDGRLMRFLLLPLLLLPLTAPALAQMKFVLQYQDQSANGIATRRSTTRAMLQDCQGASKATGKRFRIVDGDGRLIDL
ncbi:hypothetical protein WH7805_05781 [Synechococcus sp. WH 7805]|nr:hypothetical protein WH7805_05781 [Synechococcus sp. WH 7805]